MPVHYLTAGLYLRVIYDKTTHVIFVILLKICSNIPRQYRQHNKPTKLQFNELTAQSFQLTRNEQAKHYVHFGSYINAKHCGNWNGGVAPREMEWG